MGAEALAIGPINTRATNELRIETRLLDDEGNAGLQMQVFIVAAPAPRMSGATGSATCGKPEAGKFESSLAIRSELGTD